MNKFNTTAVRPEHVEGRFLKVLRMALISTLSDYMIYIFQDGHSIMDSCQAILPDALRENANPFQRYLCWSRRPHKRIHAPWIGLSLPSMALDTDFPAGMTDLSINLTKLNYGF